MKPVAVMWFLVAAALFCALPAAKDWPATGTSVVRNCQAEFTQGI